MIASVIRAEQLTKCFKQAGESLTVLNKINASFEQGHTYALTGVSGAGKSTLLHLLAGLDQPTAGTIMLNNKAITSLSALERSQTLGLVFQSSYLIKELSVIENVMMPGLIQGNPYEELYVHAKTMLTTVGLVDKAAVAPATLSGGQQQRVAIVRALFNKPLFLLADEPTGNLDEKTGREIVKFLIDCQREWKMGLIVSTHDRYVAEAMEIQFVLHNNELKIAARTE